MLLPQQLNHIGKKCAQNILGEKARDPMGKGAAMQKPKALILCIDDAITALEASKELLEISGYEVLTAQSGKEGLELFLSHPIDAVVLDYQMPGMNGNRVASQMRRVKPHVPILMFSGYSELSLGEVGCVDAILHKGESWSTVISTLERLLNLHLALFARWWEDWKHQLRS
jgi:CheY-like chemotaxis protein